MASTHKNFRACPFVVTSTFDRQTSTSGSAGARSGSGPAIAPSEGGAAARCAVVPVVLLATLRRARPLGTNPTADQQRSQQPWCPRAASTGQNLHVTDLYSDTSPFAGFGSKCPPRGKVQIAAVGGGLGKVQIAAFGAFVGGSSTGTVARCTVSTACCNAPEMCAAPLGSIEDFWPVPSLPGSGLQARDQCHHLGLATGKMRGSTTVCHVHVHD